MNNMREIPKRRLGKTEAQVSILGLGGSHIGYKTLSDDDAVSLIREAVDAGITFLDNNWGYHNGCSEERMGQALRNGYRDKAGALKQLDDSLRRLQTDCLDLWQVHEVIYYNDPDWLREPGGAIEALDEAKQAGKVRFTGFTGHKDPAIFMRMFDLYDFDTVQMPLNVMDAHFRSFHDQAMPTALAKDMGVIGMKPFGDNFVLRSGVVTPREALSYSLSTPASVVVTGIDSRDVLRQNLEIARGFQCLSRDESDAILAKTRDVAGDGRYELYKTSMRFDANAGRKQHGFPLMTELAA